MVVQPPFMYDNAGKETSRYPYNEFDPKAVTRASLTPRPPRPKQEGPFISFNRHPDSYLVLPNGAGNGRRVSPWMKNRITQTRIVILIIRVLQLLAACGSLAAMILISGIDTTTAWFLRIPPGLAILHTLYGVYHLSRRPSGRTPGSSASYMFFASAYDLTLIPFYAFYSYTTSAQVKMAMAGSKEVGAWTSLLHPTADLMTRLSGTAFLCSTIAAGLHVLSLALSVWVGVMFRKITLLPPDMNPLEDNLTARPHKRNKSSMSVSTMGEKRLSDPFESKRSSGAPYEDISRPPTIPFMHTRTGSSGSASTYQTTPPGSRDSRSDLPSRQYQIETSSTPNLKRSSMQFSSQPPAQNRASYTSIASTDSNSTVRSPTKTATQKEAWFSAASLPASRAATSRTCSPTKSRASYHPLHYSEAHDSDDISSANIAQEMNRHAESQTYDSHLTLPLPLNPLSLNPPTPRLPHPPAQRIPTPNRHSALTELSMNGPNVQRLSSSIYSGDIAEGAGRYDGPSASSYEDDVGDGFKARRYGELKAGPPPILVGRVKGQRQVSTGNDLGLGKERREVSGKVVEEGRSVAAQGGGWGTRFRKVSGF